MGSFGFLHGRLTSEHLAMTRGALGHVASDSDEAADTKSQCPNCCVSRSGLCTAGFGGQG